MISSYHNHGGIIPEMLPVKNRDGTFTICEKVFIMRIGSAVIKAKVRA